MRILSTVIRSFYRHPEAVEPMYLEFTIPLRRLGHEVHHFDHVNLCEQSGPDVCGQRFFEAVRAGGYDLILYQTAGRDWMCRQAISDAAALAPIVAWNSDDDWQWDSYTRHLAPLFTYMVTTYPDIYERNRAEVGNLRLSQWACLRRYDRFGLHKDLGFTFAGQLYRSRVEDCRYLRRRAGLSVYGLGAPRVYCRALDNARINKAASRLFPGLQRAMTFREINGIWNRSKVSYTPMGASVNPRLWQIKSRTFEMGLSGTLMLCQPSPHIERYYEPGREFVPFTSLEQCAELARYYLSHESERAKIAEAYRRRTLAEHLWERRWEQVLASLGLDRPRRSVSGPADSNSAKVTSCAA